MNKIIIFFIKVFGKVWFIFCIPFRDYARSVVYNYVLQNNKEFWLNRLWQRKPEYDDYMTRWYLHKSNNPVHGKLLTYDGLIDHRDVSKLKFYLVVIFIWGWLDDDSNHDTTDLGYISSWFIGERENSFFAPVVGWLVGDVNVEQVFGNSFDLGDVRAHFPFFNFWCAFFWNFRNTGMNFQYLFDNY